MVALSLTWRSAWRRSALLFAVAATGQCAALWMTETTRYAIYPHYGAWTALLAGAPLALVIIGAQGVLAAALAWRHRSLLWKLLTGVGAGGCLVVAVVLAAGAAVPTESIGRSAGELALSVSITLISLMTVALAAAAAPEEGLAQATAWLTSRCSLPGEVASDRPWDRRLPWIAAGIALVLSAAISRWVLEGVPHIDDSISHLFQAKVFASGQLSAPAPPDSAAFQVDEILIDGPRWFGYAFPGWPAVLSLGVLAGVPWIVNPLLGAALVLLAHALVKRWYDAGHANLVAVLLAVSPWHLFMSAEFMGHGVTAVLGTAGLYAVSRERESGAGHWALVAGLLWACLVLVRPLDAILYGAVASALALFAGVPRWRPVAVVTGLGASAMGAAILLWYNVRLTGRALYTPQMMWTDRRWGVGLDRLGFGADIGIPEWRQIDPVPGHGIPDVLLNLNKNLYTAQSDLHGWAMGSLLLIAVVLAFRLRRGDAALTGLVAAFVVGYSAYWFSGGPDLGPRYWYPAVVALVALSVRGAVVLTQRWHTLLAASGSRVALALLLATVLGLTAVVPWRASVKHFRYRDVSGDLRGLIAGGQLRNALVFVRGERRSDYQSAFNFNQLPLGRDASPVFAWDRGAASREAVRRAFPDRPVTWIERAADGTFRVAGSVPVAAASSLALEDAHGGVDVGKVGEGAREERRRSGDVHEAVVK